MDTFTMAMIVGAVLPFPLAFLRRYIEMNRLTVKAVTLAMCLGVVVGLRLHESNWSVESVLSDLAGVLAASQLVYKAVQELGVVEKIEGDK